MGREDDGWDVGREWHSASVQSDSDETNDKGHFNKKFGSNLIPPLLSHLIFTLYVTFLFVVWKLPDQHLLTDKVFSTLFALCGSDGISREREAAAPQELGPHGRRARVHTATQQRNKRRQLIRKYTDELIPEMYGALTTTLNLWTTCYTQLYSAKGVPGVSSAEDMPQKAFATLLRCFRMSLHQSIVGQITVTMLRLAYTVAHNHRNNSPGSFFHMLYMPVAILCFCVEKNAPPTCYYIQC